MTYGSISCRIGSLVLLSIHLGCGAAVRQLTGEDGTWTGDASTADVTDGNSSSGGVGTSIADTGSADPGTADTGSDSTGDTGAPASLCDGALWVTIVEQGDLTRVALDSRGHAIGFGSRFAPSPYSGYNPLLADLDAQGMVVRTDTNITSGSIGWRSGGVDATDNVYVIFSDQNGSSRLRKIDPFGLVVQEIPIDNAYWEDPLAVAPDGSVVVTASDPDNFGSTIITRYNSELALEWQLASDLTVLGLSSAGMAIASRYPQELVMLHADGSVAWSITLDVLDLFDADINESGQIVAGGRTTNDQVYVARFDLDGSQVWDTRFNVYDRLDLITDVEINELGEVAAAGDIQPHLPAAYAVKLSADGEVVATHVCSLEQESEGLGVALDDAGRMRLSGRFELDLDYFAFDLGHGRLTELAVRRPYGRRRAGTTPPIVIHRRVRVRPTRHAASRASCTFGHLPQQVRGPAHRPARSYGVGPRAGRRGRTPRENPFAPAGRHPRVDHPLSP